MPVKCWNLKYNYQPNQDENISIIPNFIVVFGELFPARAKNMNIGRARNN